MTFPHDPQEHEHFESLCTGVEDYEPLPVITTRPDIAPLVGDEAQSDSLNDEILAGLVTP
ncbi:MAG TPA: hypothetical protein VG405_03150 [Solirubrobacteraceae bacterium]|jgi:hypothetical protein|nr:hypothetical protein [Solirubrobacteraceae bacterium]